MKLIRALYSIYALGLFFLTCIPTILVYVIIYPLPEVPRMRFIYVYNRIWLATWGALCGIFIRVRGTAKKDPRQTYVILSNHCNLFDIIMTGSCIQHPFKPLIKKELLKVPLLGQLLAMTSLPIDRSSHESRAAGFQRMLAEIRRGMSILIFPEGTRNRTDKPLKEFYDGAFRLAVEAQVPILPVVLLDIRQLQPVGTFWVSPGSVSLNFLDPIPTAGKTEADVEALKQQAFHVMEAYLLAHDRSFSRKPAAAAA
ncbi:MAG: lysophospholipid acyltransferase family protein [Bacteroidia bacterium]|nr:lysophospholipid acyltransferase family protein [Bacteroidia bacterium]